LAEFEKLMKLAFKTAEKGLGYTSPNPPVGAVIFKNGRVISTGYHHKAGKPHAEIEALNKAGNNTKNATIIVTLEPCSHFGKTPPCAEAIINAGIKKVIAPLKDPNPAVSGMGFTILKKAGIEVVTGIGTEQAKEFYKPYYKFITSGKPYVTLKFAQSVDGRIAASTGHSSWISADKSLKYAHKLRVINDAILIGTGTLNSDDSKLTVRLVKGRNPIRIVLTHDGEIDFTKSLFNDGAAPTYIAGPSRTKLNLKNKAEYIKVRKIKNGIDINDLLNKLGNMGIMRLLVEGGSKVLTSFLNQKCVDRIEICITPKIIGSGINSLGDLGVKSVDKSLILTNEKWKKLGPDMILSGEPVWR